MNRVNNDDPCGVFVNEEAEGYTIAITAAAEEEQQIITTNSANRDKTNKLNDNWLIQSIFPKPFADQIRIRLSNTDNNPASITRWNTLGIAADKQTTGPGATSYILHTSNQPSGRYLPVVESSGKRKTMKLVK